jgi:negative regulator of sigma E activity
MGSQVASQGVVTSDNLLAYGVSADKKFITVVGDVSPDVAAKIAASVTITTQ